MVKRITFTERYITAFITFALLSILGYVNLDYLVSQQKIDAKIINISGQQRMLSQKILLNSILQNDKELKENIEAMKKNKIFLVSNDMNEELKTLYYSKEDMLIKRLEEYLENATKFLNTKNDINFNYIQNHSEEILGFLDKAVTLYQRESEKKIHYLHSVELVIIVVTLLTLAITMRYIFMPADKKMKEYASELEDENRQLSLELAKKSEEIIEKHVICSKTDLQGNITYVSEAFETISGYLSEELVGQKHNIVRHPDMAKEIFEDLWKTIKSGNTWHGEVKNRKKDGSIYWVYSIIEPIIQNFKIVGYSSIRQNITSKKELDELNKSLNEKISLAVKELEDKNKLMMQQSRLAQMGEMISMIGHQWRQPLASISSVVSNLSIKIELDKFEDKYFLQRLATISSLTQHLSSTIDDFKNFFEPSSGKKEVTSTQIIADSLHIIDGSLKNINIKIITKIDSDRKFLTYDNELKQVVINLITNAKDALLENNIENPEIVIEAFTEDNHEVLRISDNGGGISEDIIEKIFDPYFSTKKSKNGTGLGLYMSKTIIEDHCKGKLIVYNNEHGAVFEIIV